MNGKSSREEREILLALGSWDMKRSPPMAVALPAAQRATLWLSLGWSSWWQPMLLTERRRAFAALEDVFQDALEDVSYLSFLCLFGLWKGTKAPSAQESAMLPSQLEGIRCSLKALHSAHSLAEKQQCSFLGGFTLGFTEQFTHCPYAAVSAATRQPALSDAEKYKRVSLKSISCQDQLRNDTTLFIYFIF